MKNKTKTMSDAELHKAINEKAEALRVFRFGITGSKVRNVKEGRNLRREIAQMKAEESARKVATVK